MHNLFIVWKIYIYYNTEAISESDHYEPGIFSSLKVTYKHAYHKIRLFGQEALLQDTCT